MEDKNNLDKDKDERKRKFNALRVRYENCENTNELPHEEHNMFIRTKIQLDARYNDLMRKLVNTDMSDETQAENFASLDRMFLRTATYINAIEFFGRRLMHAECDVENVNNIGYMDKENVPEGEKDGEAAEAKEEKVEVAEAEEEKVEDVVDDEALVSLEKYSDTTVTEMAEIGASEKSPNILKKKENNASSVKFQTLNKFLRDKIEAIRNRLDTSLDEEKCMNETSSVSREEQESEIKDMSNESGINVTPQVPPTETSVQSLVKENNENSENIQNLSNDLENNENSENIQNLSNELENNEVCVEEQLNKTVKKKRRRRRQLYVPRKYRYKKKNEDCN